ncbi:hypothetical protein ACFV6F_36440 [Kitasatospora phosalacinea]|uniref:hypothetical protein n=1 Tax=Kitasatospora phosalacinea TaxID=2065 RepID=UPI00365DA396
MTHRPSARVDQVLLADGWHHVHAGTYKVTSPAPAPRGRRRGQRSPLPSATFSFGTADGSTITGPLTSVLAVRTFQPVEHVADVLVQWCGNCNDGRPTGDMGERWITTANGREAHCPHCWKKESEPAGQPRWCGRCLHPAARWTTWGEGRGLRHMPCPDCHPDLNGALTRVPKARAVFMDYLADIENGNTGGRAEGDS